MALQVTGVIFSTWNFCNFLGLKKKNVFIRLVLALDQNSLSAGTTEALSFHKNHTFERTFFIAPDSSVGGSAFPDGFQNAALAFSFVPCSLTLIHTHFSASCKTQLPFPLSYCQN